MYDAVAEQGFAIDPASRFPDEDRHIAEFLEHGYTIIPNAIPKDLLDEVTAAIERMEREVEPARAVHSAISGKTFRVQNLLNKDPVFRKALDFDPLVGFAQRLLGPQMLLQTAVTLCVGPGAIRQPIHTDDIYMDAPRPHKPFIVNSIWAIDDFTEENGATRVVPGTQKLDHTPRPTLREIAADPLEVESVCAEMKRGSIVVIDGSVWHGAGTNASDRRRAGMAVAYCKGWMRQQENFQLAVSVDLARELSPRLQQLCGFGIYQGIIGNIDGKTPAEVFGLGDPA